jgi:hypothetical protein
MDTEPVRVYAGRIRYEDVLGEGHKTLWLDDEPLADLIHKDMEQYGAYLSIRYYVSVTPLTDATEPVAALMCSLYGDGDAEYDVRYSEITGYLWTDEWLRVGGHDLLAELTSADQRWLWLEIRYSNTGKE